MLEVGRVHWEIRYAIKSLAPVVGASDATDLAALSKQVSGVSSVLAMIIEIIITVLDALQSSEIS